eukprot:scaffold7202_cov403-Prasinococcus_capsulatus_cf.AAC.1
MTGALAWGMSSPGRLCQAGREWRRSAQMLAVPASQIAEQCPTGWDRIDSPFSQDASVHASVTRRDGMAGPSRASPPAGARRAVRLGLASRVLQEQAGLQAQQPIPLASLPAAGHGAGAMAAGQSCRRGRRAHGPDLGEREGGAVGGSLSPPRYRPRLPSARRDCAARADEVPGGGGGAVGRPSPWGAVEPTSLPPSPPLASPPRSASSASAPPPPPRPPLAAAARRVLPPASSPPFLPPSCRDCAARDPRARVPPGGGCITARPLAG